MKINEVKGSNFFTFTELNGNYAVKVNVKDHMKELFEKHREDGFVCCGFDWCTLIVTFIENNDKLKHLWNVFDYEPSDYELYILSEDEAALHQLVCELDSVYNDTGYIEWLMSLIDYR